MTSQLRELTEADPLAERPGALLMRALASTGRQADPLAVYAQARELLADRLGVDPSPGSRRPTSRSRGKRSRRPFPPVPLSLHPNVWCRLTLVHRPSRAASARTVITRRGGSSSGYGTGGEAARAPRGSGQPSRTCGRS